MPGIIVVGTQWGDEGKGKATDQLGTGVDVVVKFNGGNNAGHTVVVDGQSYALHLLPAGILNPQATPVIGNGVVVDLQALFAEIDLMESRGVDCSKLLVSANAHVIPSYNRIFDRATEEHLGKRQIGTTGRGIGPTYADKMNRIGVRIQDVLNEDVLRQRVKGALLSKNELMSSVYGMEEIDPEAVVQELLAYQERLRPMVVDTSLFVNQAMDANQIVLFEAGQAAMLDIDHGTYPYVTSSNAIAGGALTGTGVGPTRINSVVGVTKAYTTRVGEGPFPSELFGEQSEHLRVLGGEYGVTTGRSRRVGWFDPLVVRYAARVNSLTDVVLTKLDVLDTYAEIPVCVGYEIDGVVVTEMPVSQVEFAAAKPILKIMPGWNEDISAIRRYQDLPVAAREYVEFLEELIGCRISSIGVGQAREAIIIRHELG